MYKILPKIYRLLLAKSVPCLNQSDGNIKSAAIETPKTSIAVLTI